MTKEQIFFTGVLADHLNKRKTASADGLNWDLLLSYAKSHQVEAILYYQCKDFLPPEIRSRLTQLYASTLFYYTNRTKQFEEICRAFAERRLSFYTVKGLDVAELYPIPALRTMGDCDIVVHSEDKASAHEMMMSLGYTNDWHHSVEWTYFKNKLEFEIHDHLLYDEMVNSQISKDFTDLAWEYVVPCNQECRYLLDASFHFVFLLLHLKKHFLNSGVGFRQFMDLAVVVQHQELNWPWIEKTLTKLELLDFAKVCLGFCERWFGIPMPLKSEPDSSFFEASTEKIFENGIFGFHDAENKDNGMLNRVQRVGKLKTILWRFFPPYKSLQYIPFLKGRPWLLPVAWIYRLIRGALQGKTTVGWKWITGVAGSDRALESRNAMLEQWGLSEK